MLPMSLHLASGALLPTSWSLNIYCVSFPLLQAFRLPHTMALVAYRHPQHYVLLASTAPPTSAVSSLVSTWSSGAPALIPVDHLPPISSLSRFPAGLPLLAPTQAGLILTPAVEPVPHKLVQCIQAEQFVEMRDLLGDNIALLQQLNSV